jgi:hypothetical protein
MVAQGLQEDVWIRDITGAVTVQVLLDYLLIWDLTRNVVLHSDVPDRLIWKWTSDQVFFTASAYRAFFIGHYPIPGAKILKKTRGRQGNAIFLAGYYFMIAAGRLLEEREHFASR